MKKKLVLSLSINETDNRFEIYDKFETLPLAQETAVLGFLSSLIHNYQHIYAQKQNNYVLKYGKTN